MAKFVSQQVKKSAFESLSFQQLNNLTILHLGHNKISEIYSNEFQGLENLEELNLERNQLSKI
jgi:Leucine-rich repeat (LRR) protein